MYTLYFYNWDAVSKQPEDLISDIAKRQGWLTDDVEVINIIGEEPASYGDFSFENMCPEVSLFDTFYSPYFTQGYATTKSCSIDGNDTIEECRHFTECAEYSSFVSNQSIKILPEKAQESLSVELYKTLIESFNLDEINTLCFYLDVEFDNLSGDGLSGKARELVKYCKRISKLDNLADQIKKMRPEATAIKENGFPPTRE